MFKKYNMLLVVFTDSYYWMNKALEYGCVVASTYRYSLLGPSWEYPVTTDCSRHPL